MVMLVGAMAGMAAGLAVGIWAVACDAAENRRWADEMSELLGD